MGYEADQPVRQVCKTIYHTYIGKVTGEQLEDGGLCTEDLSR